MFQRETTVFSSLAKSAGILILVALAGVAHLPHPSKAFPRSPPPPRRWAEEQHRPLLAFPRPAALRHARLSDHRDGARRAVAIGIALFISHYAPRSSPPVAYLIDLLAAVPSIVFGLWGLRSRCTCHRSTTGWTTTWAGIPFFEDTGLVPVALLTSAWCWRS